VSVFHGTEVVAVHARSHEPHTRVVDSKHYAGLLRPVQSAVIASAPEKGALEILGRSLSDYAAVVEGRVP
jgi:hypothetical protein